MKPTRNIMKPSGLWTPKRNVWYKHNDDDDIAKDVNERLKEIKENPDEWKRKKNIQVRKLNKAARELGYAGGYKQFEKENK
jgi:hypothetical protein